MRAIIVHIGGIAASPLLYDWLKRAGRMDIFLPQAFSLPGCLPWPAQASLAPSLNGNKLFPPLEPGLEAMQKEWAKASPCSHLVLSCPGLYLWPKALARLSQELARRFPGAVVSAFLSLVRQDAELEARSGYASLAFCLRNAPGMYLPFPATPPYDQALQTTVAVFGQKSVHVSAHDSPEAAQTSFAGDFSRLFEPDCEPNCKPDCEQACAPPESAQSAPALSLSPPLYFHGLPRELLAFICAVHSGLATAPRVGPALYPWGCQALRFGPQSDWPLPRHSLLGPVRHKEILEKHEAANARAAQMLGLPRLFSRSGPEPEPDWEPWTGLEPESARMVAERLEPAFRQRLLAAFNPIADHYLSREERIVRQALREVEAKMEAAPVLRAALPSPAPSLPVPPVPQHPPGGCFQIAPTVSVLTLTYNHAKFIEENIQSVIAQKTDFPFEHIIADDGSDDGTQDIILDYAAKYPHITPILSRERRQRLNVRALFEMARSPYVALCDGDDYFTDPGKLQIQADFLDANPSCALCFHPVQVLYEDGSKPPRVYPPPEALPRGVRPFYYLADLLRFNMIQTNSVMYRWRFAKGLPGWFRPDLLPGDWYWHLLHAETGKIGFLNKIMSVYRRHKKSVYYSAELDILLHRAKMGMHELELYAAVNQHFSGKYASLLGNMANGVFSHVLLHARDTGDNSLFEAMVKKYPDFAARYLESLKKTQTQSDGKALSPEDTA